MDIISKFELNKLKPKLLSSENIGDYTQFTLTLLSILIFGFFAIRPFILSAFELEKKKADIQIIEQNTQNRIDYINDITQNQDRYDQLKGLISKALPETPEEGLFIRDLSIIARKSSVNLKSITFSLGEDDTLGQLTFAVTVNGNFSDLTRFIDNMTKFIRIINIESIAIRIEKGENSQMEMAVRGITYFNK